MLDKIEKTVSKGACRFGIGKSDHAQKKNSAIVRLQLNYQLSLDWKKKKHHPFVFFRRKICLIVLKANIWMRDYYHEIYQSMRDIKTPNNSLSRRCLGFKDRTNSFLFFYYHYSLLLTNYNISAHIIRFRQFGSSDWK